MSHSPWRALMPAERSLVEAWVGAWNRQMRDTAVAGADLEARNSCHCGMCPSFAVRPLALDPQHTEERPLAVESTAFSAGGNAVAGLIVFPVKPGEVDFEIYPFEDTHVALVDVTFDWSSA